MGMITGCPACGTLFKVVPDQLKVSDGWVRCGHCNEVFDASARLQDADALLETAQVPPPAPARASGAAQEPVPAFVPPPPSSPPPPPAPPPEPVWAPAPWRAEPPAPELSALHPWEDSLSGAPARTLQGPVLDLDISRPAPLAADDLPPAVIRPESATTARALAQEASEPGDYLREVEALRSAAAAAEPAQEAADSLAPGASDVSFVRQARRRAFWRRPLVRAVLFLLVLGLGGLLAAQAGLQLRERLVAQWPQLRPALQALCALQGCSIGPWRQIDALVIDSSGFTRLRAETYRLTVVLNNQAALPVAMPHLELTLTDTQEQALVRRVLSPRDLGATADTLAAGTEWNGAATVSVALPAAVGRVAGYRLLAFYP